MVTYKGDILLVKRNENLNFYPGYWNGVSGFLDDHRSLEEKVQDELIEELGITQKDIQSVRLCKIFDPEEPAYNKTWIVHAVLAIITTNVITLDWEAHEYVWTDFKKHGDINFYLALIVS